MFSQRKFTPGNNSNAKRIINYNAVYDQLRANPYNQTYNQNINICIRY